MTNDRTPSVNRGPAALERAAFALVAVCAPRARRDEIVGDLVEELDETVRPERGAWGAAFWVLAQAVASAPHLLGMRARALGGAPVPAAATGKHVAPVARDEAHAVFATFIAHARARRELRRAPLMLSVAVHAALLVLAVASSVWSIEELPPAVLTNYPLYQPPPPPRVLETPPVLVQLQARPTDAGGSRGDKTPPKRIEEPPRKTPPRTQPEPSTEPPQEAPSTEQPSARTDDGGETGAHVGKDARGDGQGPPGSEPGFGDGPATVGPSVAKNQCVDCPTPELPPAFVRAGIEQTLIARICVDAQGAVTNVRVLRSLSPAADEGVAATLRRWRFIPYRVADRSVPFCYVSRFVFIAR